MGPGLISSARRRTTGGDPYWANVVLLLGMNGANGSTTIPDESSFARGNASIIADAHLDTANKKFGSAGLSLDGITDAITYPDSNDFSFGSGDFTVECFFDKGGTVTQTDALLSKWNGASDHEFGFFVRTTLIEFYWSTTGSNSLTVNYNPNFNAALFHHIAFSRVGNTGHLCFDGSIVATASMTGQTISNEPSILAIGGNNNGSTANFTGVIDEVRITKGVGRYSGSVGASYALPTQEFPRF